MSRLDPPASVLSTRCLYLVLKSFIQVLELTSNLARFFLVEESRH